MHGNTKDNRTMSSSTQPSNSDVKLENFIDFSMFNLSESEKQFVRDIQIEFSSHVEPLNDMQQQLTPDILSRVLLKSIEKAEFESENLLFVFLLIFVAIHNPSLDLPTMPPMLAAAVPVTDVKPPLFSEKVQGDLEYILNSNMQFKQQSPQQTYSLIYLSQSDKQHLMAPLATFFVKKFEHSVVMPFNFNDEEFQSADSAIDAVTMAILSQMCRQPLEDFKTSYKSHPIFDIDNLYAVMYWMCTEKFSLNGDYIQIMVIMHGIDAFRDCYPDNDE